MARSLSAKKRARQSLKRYGRNKSVRSGVKTETKKIRLMIADLLGKKTESPAAAPDTLKTALSRTASILDKAVAKGVIHKNKAARLKSRLSYAANKVT